jgi:23S rRNA (guanosine2251-2'-O)-methyltransferase
VEDPHNLGAILRSADGAGVSGVILPKRRTAPLSDVVWKASAGAAAHVPLARVANVAQTLEALKERGIWVAGADMAGDREWHQLDWTGPVALVLAEARPARPGAATATSWSAAAANQSQSLTCR